MNDFQPLSYKELAALFPMVKAPNERVAFLAQFDDYALEAMTRDGYYNWANVDDAGDAEILVATLEELEAVFAYRAANHARWEEAEAYEATREAAHQEAQDLLEATIRSESQQRVVDSLHRINAEAVAPSAEFSANNMVCQCGQHHSLMLGQGRVKCQCGAAYPRPSLNYLETATVTGAWAA